jgi:hypothetical protein
MVNPDFRSASGRHPLEVPVPVEPELNEEEAGAQEEEEEEEMNAMDGALINAMDAEEDTGDDDAGTLDMAKVNARPKSHSSSPPTSPNASIASEATDELVSPRAIESGEMFAKLLYTLIIFS